MTTSESTSKLVAHGGVQIELGGRTYVLPPMSLATRKKDIATRKAMADGYDELMEQDLLLEVISETLRRNYPDITIQLLESSTDFAELVEAYARLKEQEARLMADLGKRVAAAALGQAAP
jgi:hypothetical protein